MENLPADYIQITLKRLKKNGMGAFYYPTAREAAEEILRQIPREATVGLGGSITVREMGILEVLIKQGTESLRPLAGKEPGRRGPRWAGSSSIRTIYSPAPMP